VTGPRLVSDAHGRLEHVLLCFPREANLLPSYATAYAALFAGLPPAVRFTVIASIDSVEAVRALLTSAGRQNASVVVAPEGTRFTVWAQDASVAVEDGNDVPCLVQPRHFERGCDGELPGLLAAEGRVRTRRVGLSFHGGHFLVGDDFVLVGRDCLDATIAALTERGDTASHPDPDSFGARVFGELDATRRFIFVGTDLELPPERWETVLDGDVERLDIAHGATDAQYGLDHLDMFISLAGRGEDGRYRLLVGSLQLADELLGRATTGESLAAIFDDIAAQLARAGFEVIRNPLPLTYGDGIRAVDGVHREVRIHYLASANNCLVQIDDDGERAVWLPTYGHGGWSELAVIDAENRRIWERLGFTVTELPSFHGFAQRKGALHCIAKDLSRTRSVRT
jgi:hypothetical protein